MQTSCMVGICVLESRVVLRQCRMPISSKSGRRDAPNLPHPHGPVSWGNVTLVPLGWYLPHTGRQRVRDAPSLLNSDSVGAYPPPPPVCLPT